MKQAKMQPTGATIFPMLPTVWVGRNKRMNQISFWKEKNINKLPNQDASSGLNESVSPTLCLFWIPADSAGIMIPGMNEQIPKSKISQFADVAAISY